MLIDIMDAHYYRNTDRFCPSCGDKTVIVLPEIQEENAGDQYLCYSCRFGAFGIGSDYSDLNDGEKESIIVQVTKRLIEFDNSD